MGTGPIIGVLRYVERNALRANWVKRAEDWPFGSLWILQQGSVKDRWPLPRPRQWLECGNEPETKARLNALRRSAVRGAPYGSPAWVAHTSRKLSLESTLRNPGRPKSQ